ncbi:hypothetical protein [Algibacillus agarilyticus]|uniref:hypothetical protein n=1 Tax=Algibacillus agarilyticus TaxID=2234133 RepID=UPI000DD0196F|nr:hypothetical protein [Algibacillus agarilyticus]
MSDEQNEQVNDLPDEVNQNTEASVTELDQLRQIVFGSAKSQLENQIANLTNHMDQRFVELQQTMNDEFSALKVHLQNTANELDDRISLNDQKQDEKAVELNAYADKIASELEISDTNSDQHFNEMQARFDKEMDQLTDTFNKKIEDALNKLSHVNEELNSSKTDRKTLARLLATVASGLEAE